MREGRKRGSREGGDGEEERDRDGGKREEKKDKGEIGKEVKWSMRR